jgi:O-succinylbenzoate synthase
MVPGRFAYASWVEESRPRIAAQPHAVAANPTVHVEESRPRIAAQPHAVAANPTIRMHARVRLVELFRVRLPLVRTFRTATSTTTAKDALLVHVVTDNAEGWGECSAQTTASYLPETLDTARLSLRDELLPRVFAGSSLDDVRGSTAAKAAVECALLDAQLRVEDQSFADWLGASNADVEAGVAIGMVDDVAELRKVAAGYAAQGYRRIKLKVAPGHDVDAVRGVRAELGDDVALQVDANGTYALRTDMERLRELDACSLQCIEQPLAPDALLDHAALAERLTTPICLDEAITSANVASDAIALKACRIVAVKAARLGGWSAAKELHDRCATAGVPCSAGGMLETGIGRAALVALAALPNFTIPGDVSASDRYFAEDVTEPFVLDGGRLRVPAGPGLGVTVRLDVLDRVTVARERIGLP